jgi:hypothetical protein
MISPIAASQEVNNSNSDFSAVSGIRKTYGDFIDMMGEVSQAYATGNAMSFKLFPGKSVTPTDASFSLFVNYSMDQYQQTISTLFKGEQYKNELDKMVYSMFGG